MGYQALAFFVVLVIPVGVALAGRNWNTDREPLLSYRGMIFLTAANLVLVLAVGLCPLLPLEE